jgi:KaiC/GvpD/RAD55 family RecA-like ATPase
MKGFKERQNIKTDIQLLDDLIIDGLPRDSFMVLLGEGGTGKSAILGELCYRFLKKGEPVIYVALDNSPASVFSDINSLGWDLTPFCENGLLRFLDCYSFRMKTEYDEKCITLLREPDDLPNFTDKLVSIMDELNMNGKGIVLIDSLTEFMTLSDPSQVVDSVKNWRARGTKERNVVFVSTLHYGLKAFEGFADVFDYMVDGIIDLRYDPTYMASDILLKQIRVRKIKGADHYTNWVNFVIQKGGLKPLIIEAKKTKKKKTSNKSKNKTSKKT